ncbi:rhamnosyl transferase [Aureococcus anophagefferens]|nr:rhamnosyl transferase [Aureococcus anophagefferens]
MNRALRCCVAVACAAAAAERGGCRRKPMLWLHVHNAGGTSLRLHAEANGEKPLEPATHNWNLAFDKDRTCREKAELLAEQPEASFTFVERPLERSDVGCAEFASARSSRRRRRGPRASGAGFGRRRRYAAHALGYFDNFLVRTLNGGKVFREVAVGALNASHVDVAARVLEDRFDVVLKLEDSLDVGPLARARGLAPARGATAHANAHSHPPLHKNPKEAARLLGILERHTALDRALFDACGAARGPLHPRPGAGRRRAPRPRGAGGLGGREGRAARALAAAAPSATRRVPRGRGVERPNASALRLRDLLVKRPRTAAAYAATAARSAAARRDGRRARYVPVCAGERAPAASRSATRCPRRSSCGPASSRTSRRARSQARGGGAASARGLAAPAVHVLSTRFQLGQEHLTALLAARVALFLGVCLPSIAAQTTTRFVWARTELWPAKEREALLGAVAPYPHVVVLDSLPPGSNSTQPRDFSTADLLRIAGVDPGEPDLAVHTMVDADDALHPDAMLHLRAAAAGATSPASPAAVICSAAAHEWRPERDRACRSGAVTFHVQSELCVTPGFTMATRLDHANETLGVRHVETRRGGDWHNRTVHVKNATPLRARTARALGFFGAWHARQKLSEAADVVLKSEKAVVADQLHARCQDGFSCKHTKQADLASYLKSGDAAPKAPHHTMGRRRRRKRDAKRERSEEQRAAAAATLGEAGATVADRVAALAAATQCAAAADVPMPCPDPKATPLFAVHVPKTGGRGLWTAVERASGQHLCDWAPMRFGHYRSSLGFDAKTSTRSPKGPPDFGDAARFEAAVAGRARDLRKKPCLTTYETSFRSVRAFGDATPAVVTMVREPTAWRRSVVAHGAERGRHGDLDALFAAGCLGADSCDLYADAHYLLYGIRRPTQALLLSAEGDYPAVGAPEPAGSLAEARAHLDGAVFGLTDHFALSECLFQFQFRGKLAKKDCDCGTGRVFGSDARTYASAPDAKRSALAALDALKAGDDADYAYAEALFFSRVRVAENATGVRLVCD